MKQNLLCVIKDKQISEKEKEELKESLIKECREKVASGNGGNLLFWTLYRYDELLEILETDPDYFLNSLRSPFNVTEEDSKNMIHVGKYLEEYDKNGKVATPLYLKWKEQHTVTRTN